MARTIVFILIGALAVYLAYDTFDIFDPGKNIVKLSLHLKASRNHVLNRMTPNDIAIC